MNKETVKEIIPYLPLNNLTKLANKLKPSNNNSCKKQQRLTFEGQPLRDRNYSDYCTTTF